MVAQSKPINDALTDAFTGLLSIVQSMSNGSGNGGNNSKKLKQLVGYTVGSGVLAGAAGYGLYRYMKFKKQLDKDDDDDEDGEVSDKKKKRVDDEPETGDGTSPKKPKARLDKQFFKRLKLLLSIVVPSLRYVVDFCCFIFVFHFLDVQKLHFFWYCIFCFLVGNGES